MSVSINCKSSCIEVNVQQSVPVITNLRVNLDKVPESILSEISTGSDPKEHALCEERLNMRLGRREMDVFIHLQQELTLLPSGKQSGWFLLLSLMYMIK